MATIIVTAIGAMIWLGLGAMGATLLGWMLFDTERDIQEIRRNK